MTKQAMSEKISNFVEHYNNAFIVGAYQKRELIYTNQVASNLFGITTENPALNALFTYAEENLHQKAKSALENHDLVVFNNVPVKNVSGDVLICDVQLGFFDADKTEVFVEITPKPDTRMEMAVEQVNQSTRAEGILNFDEKLSLIYCNDHFHGVFESNEEKRHSHYGNDFSNGFQPEIREDLLVDIHKNLTESKHFTTRMKVITAQGKTLWYSLELHRRTLDSSGSDKIMAYLVNVERQVKQDAQLEDISQYFKILQSMSEGLLYRFDVHTRTLYRNAETAKMYQVPAVAENFPDKKWLEEVLHPDDITGFVDYMDRVVSGEEGSFLARLRTPSGEKQYHEFTFKGIYKSDGSLKEMVGCANNVHNLKETQKELQNVNQYFCAIQELSDDLLFRIDIEKKTLIRREKVDGQANLFGANVVAENFPESVCENGIIHPEDVKTYLKFGHRTLKGLSATAEVRMKSKNGDFGFRRIFAVPVENADGSIQEMLGKVVNIDGVRQLEQQAQYDDLTQVLNKRAMLERSSECLSKSIRDDIHALLFLDLDDFKYVNDNLGHSFGDYLLKELGARLKENTRHGDLVGRVGGDEFVVFLRNVPTEDMLLGKAKMLLAAISEDIILGDLRHSIHGSIGVAVYPEHGASYEELYHHADLGLYRSKHKGKNQVTMYDETIKEEN